MTCHSVSSGFVTGGDHRAVHARPAGLARLREAINPRLEETSSGTALAACVAALCLPKISSAQVKGIPCWCRSAARRPQRSVQQPLCRNPIRAGGAGADRNCDVLVPIGRGWFPPRGPSDRAMIGCASATGLPQRDEHVRVTAPAAGKRPGQGRRDPGATAPGHCPAAAAGHDPAPAPAGRPSVPGRPAAPAPTQRAQPVPAAGPAGHGVALAPEPANAPTRGQVPAPAPGPTAHRTFHPAADSAPSPGEPSWGYRRIHGELLVLGIKVAACAVWEILRQAGIGPAPDRASTTWASFLRSQADALLACDFFETVTLGGARLFVLARTSPQADWSARLTRW